MKWIVSYKHWSYVPIPGSGWTPSSLPPRVKDLLQQGQMVTKTGHKKSLFFPSLLLCWSHSSAQRACSVLTGSCPPGQHGLLTVEKPSSEHTLKCPASLRALFLDHLGHDLKRHILYSSGSHLGAMLPPKGHLAMFGDVFVVTTGDGTVCYIGQGCW